MGVDTDGFLKPEITATDVYNVIVSKFDKNAMFYVKVDSYDNREHGSIVFDYNKEKRNIFYCVVQDKVINTEYENGELHVSLSLGNHGSSVEIMTEIVKCFGGYLDENDCDDQDAFYIPKDDTFKYSDYIANRDEIVNILDKGINKSVKIQIANQILKHKDQLKELL